MRRPRHQSGQIIERSGAYFVRYYTRDSSGKRTRVCHRLCVRDAKHRSVSCSPVKQLADAHMLSVNASVGSNPTSNPSDVKIADFWTDTYLPWLEKEKRPSTVRSYRKLWKTHLEAEFRGKSLSEYRTFHGSTYLSKLAGHLSRNPLQAIRSLASAIFAGAVARGLIESNPWRDAKSFVTPKKTKETEHYLLGEAEDVMNALVSRVDCQAVFALCFWLGLRPSEVAGLKFGDLDFEHETIHIRRSIVNGVVEEIDETKTEGSVRDLPMIEPCLTSLKLWAAKCAASANGNMWVFASRFLTPMNPNNYQTQIMKPLVEKAGLKWKSLYCARRGCGTVLTSLTGDALAAMQVLGHRSLSTTTGHYIKPSVSAGLAGLKLLEAKTKA
jgi:integrase